jgi:hypothetical protein
MKWPGIYPQPFLFHFNTLLVRTHNVRCCSLVYVRCFHRLYPLILERAGVSKLTLADATVEICIRPTAAAGAQMSFIMGCGAVRIQQPSMHKPLSARNTAPRATQSLSWETALAPSHANAGAAAAVGLRGNI